VLLTARSWRDPPERDEPRGGGRSHRGSDGRDSVHYDRGDYRRKRFDGNYDDEEEDGTTAAAAAAATDTHTHDDLTAIFQINLGCLFVLFPVVHILGILSEQDKTLNMFF